MVFLTDPYERVAQFNLERIFIKLDFGFQSLVGFRILSAGFRIPKPRIPDSTSKKFLDSGIRGSQWGGGFYGYRLKFWFFYGYRLILISYG